MHYLSYDVAVIQWITSCHKIRIHDHTVITLWRDNVRSLTTSVSTMRFLLELLPISKAIKSSFKGSYDKQNLTIVVISYEIYETRQRLVSQISYEMTTRVRSSISITDNIRKSHIFCYVMDHHISFTCKWSSVRYWHTLQTLLRLLLSLILVFSGWPITTAQEHVLRRKKYIKIVVLVVILYG